MTLSFFRQWQCIAFPEFTWFSSDRSEFFFNILLLFGLLSLCYLAISFLTARFLPGRRQKLTIFLSSLYTIGSIIIVFEVASFANCIPFAPLYLLFALGQLNLGFVIAICGNWFTNNRETDVPLSLFHFLRANYWFTLLSMSLLILIILIQVPVIAPDRHIIFFGPVIMVMLTYFCLTWILGHHSCTLFGLQVDSDTLPDNLKTRFTELEQFVQQQGDYQLLLLKKGFRNAVAQYPLGKILLGVDLLEHLSTNEAKAIMLHELGHLQDSRYVPLRHRIGVTLPFLVLIYLLADQGDLFPSFLIQTSVFFLGLGVFSFVFKRLRLKGEYVADTFVKDFPGDFHQHLITGLKRLTRLNGIDENFCKTTNYGHLDVDEREKMVIQGKFSVQRKTVRTFFLTLVPTVVLVVLIQLGWAKYFPSEVEQWRQLHNRFHALSREGQREQAAETIRKALDFSIKHFGEIHNRTYISLNDLANISLRQGNITEAEEYVLRAGNTGEQLYGLDDLHRVKDQRILARIRLKQNKNQEAEDIYIALLSLQQRLHDKSWKTSRTLYTLAGLADNDKAIEYYQQIVQLYRDITPGTDEGPGMYIFSELADAYISTGRVDEADALLQEGIVLVNEKEGKESDSYGYILLDYGRFLTDREQFQRSEEIYQQCITVSREMSADISIDCLYGLANIAHHQGQLGKADRQLRQALSRQEQLYGKNAEELLYGLRALAQLAEEAGKMAEAETLQQRLRSIAEKAE